MTQKVSVESSGHTHGNNMTQGGGGTTGENELKKGFIPVSFKAPFHMYEKLRTRLWSTSPRRKGEKNPGTQLRYIFNLGYFTNCHTSAMPECPLPSPPTPLQAIISIAIICLLPRPRLLPRTPSSITPGLRSCAVFAAAHTCASGSCIHPYVLVLPLFRV